MNKLEKLVLEVTRNMENYDLGIALDNIYSFIWNEFCDWYIEMVKTRIYSEDEETKITVSYILNHVLRTTMKLLHPFMPFVTSEVYSNLIQYSNRELMVSSWPDVKNDFEFEKEEQIVEKIKDIIVEIRNIRANKNIHPSKKADLIFVTENYKKELEQAKDFILKMGFGKNIEINKSNIPDDSIQIVTDEIELYMPLEGLIDKQEEQKRKEEERKRLEQEVARCEKMLSNSGFINKAPQAKIEEEKAKLEKYKSMLEKL